VRIQKTERQKATRVGVSLLLEHQEVVSLHPLSYSPFELTLLAGAKAEAGPTKAAAANTDAESFTMVD
jgi:hypothetical protein